MDLDALRVTKSARKAAKRSTMTVVTCFCAVARKCVEQHSLNWVSYVVQRLLQM